jgi:transposase
MSYSLDLRERVILYVLSGHTKSSASDVFNIGISTVRRWILLKEKTGNLSPLPHGVSK